MPYTSLIFPANLLGLNQPLRDLWAHNVSLLASRSVLLQAQGPYCDLPPAPVLLGHERARDNLLPSNHKTAAAIDLWTIWRTPPNAQGGSHLLPLPSPSSANLVPILTLGGFEESLNHNSLLHVSRRLELPLDEGGAAQEALDLLRANCKILQRSLPAHITQHQLMRLTNALSTSRRYRHLAFYKKPEPYRNPDQVCYVCGLPGSEDSLNHFITCQRIQQARDKFLTLLAIPGVPCLPPIAAALATALSPTDTTFLNRYSHFLCIQSSCPTSRKAYLMAIATFNWACWKIRGWAVDTWSDAPPADFEAQACYLALTTLNGIRSRSETSAQKAKTAAAAKKAKPPVARHPVTISPSTRPGRLAPSRPLDPPLDMSPAVPPDHHHDNYAPRSPSSPTHPSPARSPHTLASPRGLKRSRAFSNVLTPPSSPTSPSTASSPLLPSSSPCTVAAAAGASYPPPRASAQCPGRRKRLYADTFDASLTSLPNPPQPPDPTYSITCIAGH